MNVKKDVIDMELIQKLLEQYAVYGLFAYPALLLVSFLLNLLEDLGDKVQHSAYAGQPKEGGMESEGFAIAAGRFMGEPSAMATYTPPGPKTNQSRVNIGIRTRVFVRSVRKLMPWWIWFTSLVVTVASVQSLAIKFFKF